MPRLAHQRWTALSACRPSRKLARPTSTAAPPPTPQPPPHSAAPKRKPGPLPAALLHHNATPVPTAANLSEARGFFTRGAARELYSAAALHQIPRESALPEVAFLGRSNAGKSTLLNAVLATSLCRTSSKPGRTRLLHAYAAGGPDDASGAAGRIAVLDMPGYGRGSRAEWGAAVSRYLAARRQLRRAYVLVDAVHGAKDSDLHMLAELRARGVVAQVVLSKVDRLLDANPKWKGAMAESEIQLGAQRVRDRVDEVRRAVAAGVAGPGVAALDEVLCASAEPARRVKALSREVGGALGVDALRWSVLQATGFAAQKWSGDVHIDQDR